MALHRTLARPATHEIAKIKGSRFLGYAAPALDEAAARAHLEEVRALHPTATHHCWAWAGLTDDDHRSSDDGEPAGTAGAPILRRIGGASVTGVVVVVVRYYGGTKLGAGGLVRAYGEAAAAVLDAAEIEEALTRTALVLRFDYGLQGAVQGALNGFDAEQVGAEYGADVALTLAVVDEEVAALIAEVSERTAGRVVPEPI